MSDTALVWIAVGRLIMSSPSKLPRVGRNAPWPRSGKWVSPQLRLSRRERVGVMSRRIAHMARPGWVVRRRQQRRVLAEFVGAVGLLIAAVAFYVIGWLVR